MKFLTILAGPRRSSLLLLGFLSLCSLASMQIAAQQPTPEQLQMLQQLSPEQQQQALNLLMERKLSVGQQDAPVEQPQVVQPRAVQKSAIAKLDVVKRSDLEPFGYDLFAGEPTTFAPATDIPVPVDYVIGPGDTVQVQLFGKDNADYSLVVSREGMLNFPEIGPISVAGLRFQQMKDDLERRISEQMIGVSVSITMGRLRSIRVFVLGEAYKPGSYTVSSLSTMTNALFVSGGVKPIGSLRNIQLKRNGRLVTRLDLYDLLLKGDTSNDVRLQPGDVIFIPPVGKTAGVAGEVRRPAVYELKNERTIGELLSLSGGMLPSAFPRAARIQRISPARDRTLIDVDLSSRSGLAMAVQADDILRLDAVLDKLEDIVILHGHVYRPGASQWHRGMRISDLIGSAESLRPMADQQYVLIRRELGPERRVSVFSTDLGQAFAAKGGAANTLLSPRDKVYVFDRSQARQKMIAPLIDTLRSQASVDRPAQEVTVGGRVRVPGLYPLEDGMRVADLIRAAGDLGEAAYRFEGELTRQEIAPDQSRLSKHLVVNLEAVLGGDAGANFLLQPHDYLTIKEKPEWRDQEVVEIRGEVRFPGTYTIQRGERLSSVINRAGGVTELAFVDGSIFLREVLRRKEQERIDELASRLESDLAAAGLEAGQASGQAADAAESLALAKSLLGQLRNSKAQGRLVIDLESVLFGRADADNNVAMQGGDELYIPRLAQEVTVIGEVHYPTSHLFNEGLRKGDFIDLSGGLTYRADSRRIYVVKANGAVMSGKRSKWFRDRGAKIEPGDTIVVPLNAERLRPLTRIAAITQILYQIGLTAASAKAVGIF